MIINPVRRIWSNFSPNIRNAAKAVQKGSMPGASTPPSDAGAKDSPVDTMYGKIALAPIISIPAFNKDIPLGIKSYLSIKGAIIKVLGTSLKNRTSSTVKVVLTENLVATMKTAQIETVNKATTSPK